MFRFLVICGCLLAVAQAGVIGGGLLGSQLAVGVAPAVTTSVAVPTIATSSSNIIRGIGNLAAISTDSKSVDTPFSSVRKADVRINNDNNGIITAALPAVNVAAPLTTAIAGHGVLGTAIAAPAITTGIAGPLGLGLGLNGLGVGVHGLGVGVNGLGVGVNGLGVGVNGLGLGVKVL